MYFGTPVLEFPGLLAIYQWSNNGYIHKYCAGKMKKEDGGGRSHS